MAQQMVHGGQARQAVLHGVRSVGRRRQGHPWSHGSQRRSGKKFGSSTMTKDVVNIIPELSRNRSAGSRPTPATRARSCREVHDMQDEEGFNRRPSRTRTLCREMIDPMPGGGMGAGMY